MRLYQRGVWGTIFFISKDDVILKDKIIGEK